MNSIAKSFKLVDILLCGRKYKAKELGKMLELKSSAIRYCIEGLRQAGFQI